MSFSEQEIHDRLMVAIGATSDIENIHARRRAAKAAAPEVLAIIHELAEKQRAALKADPGILEHALIDLIDPQKEGQ